MAKMALKEPLHSAAQAVDCANPTVPLMESLKGAVA
jgi:hypothetical protein